MADLNAQLEKATFCRAAVDCKVNHAVKSILEMRLAECPKYYLYARVTGAETWSRYMPTVRADLVRAVTFSLSLTTGQRGLHAPRCQVNSNAKPASGRCENQGLRLEAHDLSVMVLSGLLRVDAEAAGTEREVRRRAGGRQPPTQIRHAACSTQQSGPKRRSDGVQQACVAAWTPGRAVGHLPARGWWRSKCGQELICGVLRCEESKRLALTGI